MRIGGTLEWIYTAKASKNEVGVLLSERGEQDSILYRSLLLMNILRSNSLQGAVQPSEIERRGGNAVS
jgi:hypothetical protein